MRLIRSFLSALLPCVVGCSSERGGVPYSTDLVESKTVNSTPPIIATVPSMRSDDGVLVILCNPPPPPGARLSVAIAYVTGDNDRDVRGYEVITEFKLGRAEIPVRPQLFKLLLPQVHIGGKSFVLESPADDFSPRPTFLVRRSEMLEILLHIRPEESKGLENQRG